MSFIADDRNDDNDVMKLRIREKREVSSSIHPSEVSHQTKVSS